MGNGWRWLSWEEETRARPWSGGLANLVKDLERKSFPPSEALKGPTSVCLSNPTSPSPLPGSVFFRPAHLSSLLQRHWASKMWEATGETREAHSLRALTHMKKALWSLSPKGLLRLSLQLSSVGAPIARGAPKREEWSPPSRRKKCTESILGGEGKLGALRFADTQPCVGGPCEV